MLMAEELDSKNPDNGGIAGQISFGEDDFYKKYEQKIKLLTDKFMPPRDEDEHLRMQKRKEMEQYADYRNYLSFSMYEQVTDENGRVIRENFVDDMAGRDSGGEGQNPKYVALLAGFAMLYMQQSNRDSKIKLVLLDEAFSKMDLKLSVVNSKGEMVPFSSFTQIEQKLGMDQINRYNMYSAASITCTPAAGSSSGQAIEAMGSLIKNQLGGEFGYEWTSVAYQETQAGNTTTCLLYTSDAADE